MICRFLSRKVTTAADFSQLFVRSENLLFLQITTGKFAFADNTASKVYRPHPVITGLKPAVIRCYQVKPCGSFHFDLLTKTKDTLLLVTAY